MLKSIAISLLFSVFTTHLSGQGSIKELTKKFEDHIGSQYEEKVYLHTDKNDYLPGETVWFKIYMLNSGAGEAKKSSKVAYIEILDLKNSPVLQTKVGLEDGTGTGSLVLPSSLFTSSYIIRAYTNWMKNFSPDFYFHKQITVTNALATGYAQREKNVSKHEIAFFPEGGNLVVGLESKVAFKVTDQFGKGVDFKGALVNSTNDTVLRFVPYKFGIGSFNFTPKKSEIYKAVIVAEGSKRVSAPFPKVYDRGYVMQTIAEAGNIKISVATNASANDSIFLFAHSEKKIKTGQAKKLLSGKAEFKFPASDLEEGITHFTIFDNNRAPVCERLYFKKPSSVLNLNASYAKNNGARDEVDIAINASDETGKSLEAAFSLSVYRIPDSYSPTEIESIATYKWLGSELPGKIENPAYYISKDDFVASDNLMLTHGWRRFKWEDVLNKTETSFRYLPEFEGHVITGKTYRSNNNEPIRNITNYLSVPGKRTQMYSSKSSSDGAVRFFTKDFYGENELVIQPDFRQDSLARTEILSPFSSEFSSVSFPYMLNSLSPSELQQASVSIQAENIYKEKNIAYRLPTIDSLPFFRHASATYLLDDYTRFPTMEEVFREYVPEIGVGIQKKKFYLEMFNLESKTQLNGTPLLLVDGVPILNDADPIMKYDPLKIQKMEVLTRRYYYGPSIFNGIASFSTYKGNLDGLQLDPRATIIDYEGLQLQREFYSPLYDTVEAKESRVPDLRSTLLWAPNVKTNNEGKANISFFTGDRSGRYLIVLEGMNAERKTGSFSGTFEVKGAIF